MGEGIFEAVDLHGTAGRKGKIRNEFPRFQTEVLEYIAKRATGEREQVKEKFLRA